jgi:hypothetical protein
MPGRNIITCSDKGHNRMVLSELQDAYHDTHCHAAVELQVGATIWATTKAEKKNKDTSGGATKRIRRDIFYLKVRVMGGRAVTVHSTV